MTVAGPALVHVVADYGPGDEVFASLCHRLGLAAPDAEVLLTQVARCDSLSAGFCVAQLALGEGPPGRVVVHDVAAAPELRPAAECAGWARDRISIVGPDGGFSWSFVATEIEGPCYLELPAEDPRSRSPQRLAAAIVWAFMRHPHALREPSPTPEVPRPPDGVIARVERGGNLATTIARPPAPVSDCVHVRIGEVRDTAVVDDGSVALADGELALGPASSGWRLRDGQRCPFLELSVREGSAAERFGNPPAGARVMVGRDAVR